VRVDGAVAKLGDRADPRTQTIELDGVRLAAEPLVYWIANKPRGVLTTTRDPEGRRTVLDLLPRGLPRVFPVGRLDWDTEGLVLLTNDGAVAHALLHPSLGSERAYEVTVRGRIDDTALRRLARGVRLDDGPTAPARVGAARFDARAETSRFSLGIGEGRKRQIRRALQALGHPVVRLLRVRMGPIELGSLAPGRARPLAAREIERLRAHASGRQPTGRQHARARPSRPKARPTPRKGGRNT
jgi:23S rRNA pseudouridine2605 synthase